MAVLWNVYIIPYFFRSHNSSEKESSIQKRKSVFSGSLKSSFYARRTSNSHHERYSYSLLGPGTLTAHRGFHLVLLHSCPDTVHGVLLRKTQTSTSLIEGSFAMKKPSDWHHPRCSGLRVQGTAISPAAHCLVYGILAGMSRILWIAMLKRCAYNRR